MTLGELSYSAPAWQPLHLQANARGAQIAAPHSGAANTIVLATSVSSAPLEVSIYEHNVSGEMAVNSGLLSAEKVIPALLSLLLAAVIFIFLWLKSDVDELKKDSKEMVKQASETRVELVKAINAVERQAAGTNSRLDQMLADRPRR